MIQIAWPTNARSDPCRRGLTMMRPVINRSDTVAQVDSSTVLPM